MSIGFEIDAQRCTECQRCMIACATAKAGQVRLADSRVRIGKSWPELPRVRVCLFDACDGQPCIAACPTEAISNQGGIVRIDAQACTGCGACVEACPHEAIRQDAEGLAFKCDFCGGAPACVPECATEALAQRKD